MANVPPKPSIPIGAKVEIEPSRALHNLLVKTKIEKKINQSAPGTNKCKGYHQIWGPL
jgi:hypothetical protein